MKEQDYIKYTGNSYPLGVFLVLFPVDGLTCFMHFVNLLYDFSCITRFWSSAYAKGRVISVLDCSEVYIQLKLISWCKTEFNQLGFLDHCQLKYIQFPWVFLCQIIQFCTLILFVLNSCCFIIYLMVI